MPELGSRLFHVVSLAVTWQRSHGFWLGLQPGMFPWAEAKWMTGWWFGTMEFWMTFQKQLGMEISSQPTFTPSFFRGVGQPPTRWICCKFTMSTWLFCMKNPLNSCSGWSVWMFLVCLQQKAPRPRHDRLENTVKSVVPPGWLKTSAQNGIGLSFGSWKRWAFVWR